MPGEGIDLSVTLTAPPIPGTYCSNWQIADADGKLFGLDGNIEDAIWLRIIVDPETSINQETSAHD